MSKFKKEMRLDSQNFEMLSRDILIIRSVYGGL